MSYERNMLENLAMPSRQEVKDALIKTLFKHNGSIKEFSSGENIVTEIADMFTLNNDQRSVVLERIYKKEQRIVRTPLWHRLLYRAAEELAKKKLVTRPRDSIQLTNKKEWLLTEKGIDYALTLLQLPASEKEMLPVKSFEIQQEVNAIKEIPRPKNYMPFDTTGKLKTSVKTASIRSRSFRQAVIETYNYTCCVCGLKIYSPRTLNWEVEAAHIVPRGLYGKDDIWNGIALCRLHHWAFDVGWFSFTDNYDIMLSSQVQNIPVEFGKVGNVDFFKQSFKLYQKIILPEGSSFYPHENAIGWHREHVFYP